MPESEAKTKDQWERVRELLIIELIDAGERLAFAFYNDEGDVDQCLNEIQHLHELVGLASNYFVCNACEGSGLARDEAYVFETGTRCSRCNGAGHFNGLDGIEDESRFVREAISEAFAA